MIDGIALTPLTRFSNEQGTVSRMLRSTDTVFRTFGEIYFSSVPAGVKKDWRLHKSLIMNLAVPIGVVQFIFIDTRLGSVTHGLTTRLTIGDDNYQLLTVPPGIWMTFGNFQDSSALIANCATQPHDPNEIERRSANDPPLPFTWE